MDVVMPQLGETVTEGTITVWHRKVGETVSAAETLFEVSTDKVDTEIPAPADGVLAEILVEAGETVGVGARLAVIDDGGAATAKPETEAQAAQAATPAATGPETAGVLSPVVARLIAEHGLEAARITGTGRGGRITRRDVLAHIAERAPEKAPAEPADERTVIPFSKINRLTAEHMVRSKATSPHVLQAVEADFSRIEAARAAHGAAWKAREGFALTYLPFVARAACLAIADYPRINASVEDDSLIVHRRINLAIAVDLDLEALVAPVIKDAGARSLADLARAIRDLASRARADQLSPDDLTEGTYTISNSGAFGTLITAPIINQPQVAILSTDGVHKRPVVVEGEAGDAIAIRPIGVLAQSFDHRAFGGAYSAAFLRRLREIVETREWTADLA